VTEGQHVLALGFVYLVSCWLAEKCRIGELVPFNSIEQTSGLALVHVDPVFIVTAKLLKEKRHTGCHALVTDAAHPINVHWAHVFAATFAANDDPMNIRQIKLAKVFDEWFYREPPNPRVH
jgi:hypothetical protein